MTSDALDKMIDSHRACENEFFARLRFRRPPLAEVYAWAPDFYFWVKAFPGILAGLVGRTRDSEFQFFLTQILFSELGSGDPERMHFRLFADILRKLRFSDEDIGSGPRYGETRELVEGMRRLYQDEDILRAMGAQYALERQAFPMIEQLYAGFKQYDHLNREDFEYFELHLIEEPEHLACMQKCMERCMKSPGDVAPVEAGAKECLDLIAAFWRRMHAEITELEETQPCSAKKA